MRGRRPTPTAHKVLNGNPGKRPLNDREPQPPPLQVGAAALPFEDGPAPVPDADAAAFVATPPELVDNSAAIAEWQRLAPMLHKCRQITEADRTALIALCIEWSRYIDANNKVRILGLVVKAPSGYPMNNPYLSIATKALSGCRNLWNDLGLTPSSRSRVHADGAPPGGDMFSEFDAPMPLGPQRLKD